MSKTREKLEKLGHSVEKHHRAIIINDPEVLEVIHENDCKRKIEDCKKRYYGFFDQWNERGHSAYDGKFSQCFALEKAPGFSSLPPETQQSVQQRCKDQIFEEYTQCVNEYRKK
jgi:hypothetical protein